MCALRSWRRQEFETCQLSARGRLGTQEPRRAVHCALSIDSENILSVTTVQLRSNQEKSHTRKICKCSIFPMGALHPSTFRLWVHWHPQHPLSRCLWRGQVMWPIKSFWGSNHHWNGWTKPKVVMFCTQVGYMNSSNMMTYRPQNGRGYGHVTVLKFCRLPWCSASHGFVSDSWATCYRTIDVSRSHALSSSHVNS